MRLVRKAKAWEQGHHLAPLRICYELSLRPPEPMPAAARWSLLGKAGPVSDGSSATIGDNTLTKWEQLLHRSTCS